jgi:hypothetical protein
MSPKRPREHVWNNARAPPSSMSNPSLVKATFHSSNDIVTFSSESAKLRASNALRDKQT